MQFRIKSGTAIVTTLSDRGTTGPYGLFEGQEGRKCGLTLWHQGIAKDLFSKSTVVMQPGDLFRFEAAGGGGIGNPLLRQPEAVINDVDNGYVTPECARMVYGLDIQRATRTAMPTSARQACTAGSG
jgi:N-methylhydantoinase B